MISDPADPVKVGLRTTGGIDYLIAVNLSGAPTDLAASSWWGSLPGLTSQGVDELTSGWSGQASGGRFSDTIPPFAVRIYRWLPQQSIDGRGL